MVRVVPEDPKGRPLLTFTTKRGSAGFVGMSALCLVAAAAMATPAAAVSTQGAGHSTASRPAPNPYSPQAGGHSYRHGAFATRDTNTKMHAWASANIAATGPQTLSYGGGVDGIGVTSGTPKVYLVFWGSQWGTSSTDANGNLAFSSDSAGGAGKLQQMFKGLGTNNELWSGVMTQYCDGSLVASGATSCPSGAPHVGYPTGGNLAGVWYDSSASEPAAATGPQLATEAASAAPHFGNTTPPSNRYRQ